MLQPNSLGRVAVDPAAIPQRKLATGATMPAVGLGTFGSDHVTPAQVAEAVKGAATVGYRHFDCASVYGNEAEVGAAFEEIKVVRYHAARSFGSPPSCGMTGMVKTMSLPPAVSRSPTCGLNISTSISCIGRFPTFIRLHCDVTSRSPDAKPYIHENYMKTWRKMEELVDLGLVRHIGTSNMTIPKLKLVLRDARIKPAVNEMELHPHFQQPELFQFVVDNGMAPIGYCPVGSPGRPERDRTPEDTSPTEDPVILAIAARHGVHPAVVCIKWAVQRGQTPIPFSINNYVANLQGAVFDPLGDEEMRQIAAIDRNCRLIKGQVFLWKDGQTWEDLWDLNGEITPP